METDEHKICILFVFEGVLMFFCAVCLWCLSVTCLFVFVDVWISFVCDWKLMSITFAYYRLARSTNGAKLTLCCFSHFWTAAQKYAFNLWPENKTKNSHNELKIAYFQARLKIGETHSETGPQSG